METVQCKLAVEVKLRFEVIIFDVVREMKSFILYKKAEIKFISSLSSVLLLIFSHFSLGITLN